MSRWSKGSIALNVVVAFAVYFGLAEWMRRSFVDPTPDGSVVVRLNRPFEKYGEYGVASYQLRSLQPFQDSTDTPDATERSPVLLYENSRLLGPAHSALAEISSSGKGRYLHSNVGFVFSASDNSDPNVNGRRYWAVVPRQAGR